MKKNSILEELKKEIIRSKFLGRRSVTHKRLEALIRMREDQNVGTAADIDAQPGEWSIRGGNVDAIQHDGTDESAALVTSWVIARGGTIIRRFSEYNLEGTGTEVYLRIESPRSPDVVGPGWWVVKTADNFFFVIADFDFHIVYVPRVRTNES